MPKISGSELIARALLLEGVSTVFTIAGDHILPALDAMADHPFRFVGCRHEAAAVHMADAYARSSGNLGVAMYTTPGFANALTGLANAMYSEAPLLSISGSAELADAGRGSMQEIDQVSAAKPFAKASWLVHDTRRIPDFIARAVRLAFSGRRGPVHLTIPVDIQEIEVDESEVVFYPPSQYRAGDHQGAGPVELAQALELLQTAERPMLIAAGPAAYSLNGDALQRLLDTTGLPLFTDDYARGIVPDSHPNVFGFFERGLNAAARMLPQADLVVLLGRKQDFTISYLRPPAVAADAKIIQVVPDADQLALNRGVDVGIVGDVTTVVSQLADAAAGREWRSLPWVEALRAAKTGPDGWERDIPEGGDGPMHPVWVHRQLASLLRPDDVLSFDGGDFCDFGRGVIPATAPHSWYYLPHFGLLGPSLPAAMGAKVAEPERRCICVIGDGGFGFNAMELETAVRERIPVVVILGNDSCWGIDAGIQLEVYGREVVVDLSPNVRYDLTAASLGCHGEYVTKGDELLPALQRAFAAADAGKPALVNILTQRVIGPRAKVAVGRMQAAIAKATGH